MKTTREIFTDNLNRIMFRQNVTQAQLAAAVGVSQGAVYFWTSGKKYPRADKIELIAKALGVRFSELVTEQSDNATVVSYTYATGSIHLTTEEELLVLAYRDATPDAQGIAMEILSLHKKDDASSGASAM